MTITITSLHPNYQKFRLCEKKISKFCENILFSEEKAEFSLSLVLIDDTEMRRINHHYRQKDKTTNVLSFPFLDGAEPALANLPIQELGDIFISLDTARNEAKEYGVSLSHRLCWLIIHGFLHLCGMDHERSQKEAEIMSAREQILLKQWQQNLCSQDNG